MNTVISIIMGICLLKIIANFISSFSINNYQYIKVYNINDFLEKLMIYSDKIQNLIKDYKGNILPGSEGHYYCKYLLNKDIIKNADGTYDLNKAINYIGKSSETIKDLDQSYDFPIIIIVPNDNKKHYHFNLKSFIIKVFSLDFKVKN